MGFGGAEKGHEATAVLKHGTPQSSPLSASQPLPHLMPLLTRHPRISGATPQPSHTLLCPSESALWRQIQMHSLPTQAILTHISPSLFPTPACQHCGNNEDAPHAIWHCHTLLPLPLPNHLDSWLSALARLGPQSCPAAAQPFLLALTRNKMFLSSLSRVIFWLLPTDAITFYGSLGEDSTNEHNLDALRGN